MRALRVALSDSPDEKQVGVFCSAGQKPVAPVYSWAESPTNLLLFRSPRPRLWGAAIMTNRPDWDD